MSISRFVVLTSVQACFALAAVPLLAQTSRPLADACADTLSAPYRERVAIDLIYDGENRREMWQAIQLAATTRTQCVVAKSALPTADTSTYGVLRINALDNGGYEIATSLAGPRAPRLPCRNPRAAITARDMPIVWGVLLALTVPAFVECVLGARGPAANSSR